MAIEGKVVGNAPLTTILLRSEFPEHEIRDPFLNPNRALQVWVYVIHSLALNSGGKIISRVEPFGTYTSRSR